jgi:hypothetical protein
MNVFEGAAAREALVERLVNEMAPTDGIIRFHIIGAIRIGVIEATHEIAQTYPQLAERIYAKFGMSGWETVTPTCYLNDDADQP